MLHVHHLSIVHLQNNTIAPYYTLSIYLYIITLALSRRQLCRGVGFCDVQAKSAIVIIGASVSIIVCVRGGGGGGGIRGRGGAMRCEAVGYVW